MKKIFAILVSAVFIIAFAGCSEELAEPEVPENEQISEEFSEQEKIPEETPEEPSGTEKVPEKEINPEEFMTFEEITALGCYPVCMKPNTVIIYDKNGNPEIVEGGALTEEDCAGNEIYSGVHFVELNDKTFRIKPNTKVEYYKDGFIQNIYYLWPDGNYNLSPLSKTENAKITYYASIDDWENESGKTVVLSESRCHSVFWISDGMNLLPESTSKPMDFPRYKITFTYVGTEHCILADKNNVFSSTMLEGGNYVSAFGDDHFSEIEKLFNEAQ